MVDERNSPEYEQQLNESRQLWNAEAASFDNEPDHGLRDPVVLTAWTRLLKAALPIGKTEILDIGCGTGSLSVIAVELGYKVTGIDFSPEMIARAKAKTLTSGYSIEFQVMDAAFPQFPQQQFDVLICRHLLWALPDIDQVLRRWVRLLKSGGRLLLIEGYWHTNAGLHAQQIVDALPESMTGVSVQHLSHQAELWGHAVNDERYVIVADLHS